MIPLTAKKKDLKEREKDEMLEQIVNLLKQHPVVGQIFDRFDIDLEFIHEIPISFDDLDVSAKAKGGKIYINDGFLEDGNFIDDIHYIVHELTHVLQQITGNVHERGEPGEDHYLDDPAEMEAFKEQIKFIDDYKGEGEADQYVDDLLDFHEFKGKKRTKKRRQLRGE